MIYLENESYYLGKALHQAQKLAIIERHEFLTPDHLLWAIAEQEPFKRACSGYEIQDELIHHINKYEEQVPEDVVLIDQSAIPVVTLPKAAAGGFLPMIPHFSINFHGIAIAQRMLVTNHRIQGIREQETSIQREFLVLGGCRKHGKRT